MKWYRVVRSGIELVLEDMGIKVMYNVSYGGYGLFESVIEMLN